MTVHKRDTRQKPIREIAEETAQEMGKSFEMFIRENIRLFIYLLQFVGFVALHVVGMKYNDVLGVTILYIVLIVVIEFLFRLNANIKHVSDEGIPVPPERYTQINDRGYITVMKEEESVQYLCSVEDYLEKKGLLRDDTTL